MDCFVAEPVIGPRFARTRWLLAMTRALAEFLALNLPDTFAAEQMRAKTAARE
jgi:hypothetical protein